MEERTTAVPSDRSLAWEREIARLRNQQRSRECGYHAPGTCPALWPVPDCGCAPADRDARNRRRGPGSMDAGCHKNHCVTSAVLSGPCPAEVGAQILHAGYYEWPWSRWPQLPADQLFTWRAIVADPTLEEALALITSQWRRQAEYGDLSPLSLAKIGGNAAQFVAYARASGRHTLRDADDTELARAWVHATVRTRDGYGPVQLPTMHNRRNALRMVYGTGRSLDLADGDPTLDLELPKRTYHGFTALGDDDVILCRGASAETLYDTAQPAAWALAELSGTTAELAAFAPCDMRPAERTVYLHGGSHTRPRSVGASAWQWQQLTARVRFLQEKGGDAFDPTAPMLYRGGRNNRTDTSPVSAVGQLLRKVLDRAGLTKQDGYTQASITAWAGRCVFERTNNIVDVANHLGVCSLDRAAQLIEFEWVAEPAADDNPPEAAA
jgi:integrase/recombinase XerC